MEAQYVVLDVTDFTLDVGGVRTINYTILPETTADKTLTWTSDNEAIAVVENGVVTAISPGETNVTATTINGISATCKVHVNTILITSLEFNKSEMTLEVGEKGTLATIILPENASDKNIVWRSSNEAIATVNQIGEVTAVSMGEALISAITTDGSYLTANCKLNAIASINNIYTDSEIKVSCVDKHIKVEGKMSNDVIVISDIIGNVIYVGKDSIIEVSNSGTYIVRISNVIIKVYVK